jgi:hypothetical protein
MAIVLTTAVFLLLNPGYRIGSMQEFGAPRDASVPGVVVFGALAFVRPVVLAVLGFYTSGPKRHWPVVLLLGIVGLGETLQATLAGGRTTVLQAILACLAVLVAFRLRQGGMARLCLGALVCAVLVLWYIPTALEYRTRTLYGGGRGELTTPNEHAVAFFEAGATVLFDPSATRSSIRSIVGRLYEPSAFTVMIEARESGARFGIRGWGDLLFRWVPNFIRAKGTDRDQHLMFTQGFKMIESTGVTLTVPADLYYRFGLAGIVSGYFCLGVVVGGFCRFCRNRFDILRFVALVSLAILVIRLYAVDFVQAVWMPLYELPIGLAVGWLVFSGFGQGVRLSHRRIGGAWRERAASP